MTDINEIIAKSKGWRRPTENECALFDGWINENTHWTSKELPDYLNDARLYMGLFEEMSSTFFSLTLMQHDYNNKTTIIGYYRQGHDENIPQFVVEAEPIGRAVCQAYIRLHGLEEG